MLGVEDRGHQARLLPPKAQPQHNPVYRGKYRPACIACGEQYPKNVVQHEVLWERMEANRSKYSPVCSDMREDKGKQPRLLPVEAQPRQNPAHRGKYSPAC